MDLARIGMSTGTSAAAQVGGQRQRHRGPDMDTVMAPVAEKLGMSVDQLKSSLAQGTTLDRIATSKGVSHTDLVAAIKQGLESAKPAAAPSGASGVFDIDAVAESIASGTRPPAPPAGGPPPGGGPHGANQADDATLDAVSQLLKMSSDDLVSALTNGTSLSDLATKQGVSTSALLDTLGQGMVVNTTM